MNNYLKRTILYCAAALIIGFVLGLLSDIVRAPRGEPETFVMTDTVTILKPMAVHDTILREVAVRFPVVRTEHDTVYREREQPQIVQRTDSAEVYIPITQRVYLGEDYTAYVSGYDPRLDSIRIRRTTIRDMPKPKSRLHLTVGAGALYNGKLAPGLFIGVGYSFCEIRL